MHICTQFRNRKQYPPLYPLVYHHRGRWPSPGPKPPLRRWTSPHAYVPTPQPVAVGVPHSRHGEHGRSGSRGARRRHVHFADQPTVIDLPSSPSSDPSSAPAPLLPRCLSSALALGHPPPEAAGAALYGHSASVAAALGLHDLLTSFPPGLWDLRQNARPLYHPHHQPRLSEPALLPPDRTRSITLSFRPCDRAELAWTTEVKVRAANCRGPLTVDDVLRAISTEMLQREACTEVCEGHPCFAEARNAHRVRTRRGHTYRPHFDDAFRNVDLFHADRGRGLYFEGLMPERVDDGKVVYVVKFSCA